MENKSSHIIQANKETAKENGKGKSQEQPHQVSLRPNKQVKQGPAKH